MNATEPEPVQEEVTFSPGDNVMLNVDGPSMVVLDVGKHLGLVCCQWVDAAGHRHEASFPAAVLKADCRSYLHKF